MQLGFDRLVRAMDAIAPEYDLRMIAQVGKGKYRPLHMEVRERIAPDEFETLVAKARLVVSHAGIGTVLTAQRLATPVVLMPRRASRGEHRNDHQLATVKSLGGRPGILVASDETQLPDRIEQGLNLGDWSAEKSDSAQQLHSAVASFIETGRL
ncbi:glycosyltransferase [Erythrobacter sp. GH1-10]|uniref:glycosyltransferase n=1 Tax=Erythrobacter sp. GH1-10 TaxID=3349334 RepID=UPI003878028D